MQVHKLRIHGIPALIYGPPSEKVYLFVHGKMGCKEAAEGLARLAADKGYQTLSFDLPEHGERKGEARRCDIWSGIADLQLMAEYAFSHWHQVSLYACSLGAYFSLHALPDRVFQKCLFQSPIVDMEYLIRQMFCWFNITPEQLEREKEIDTPIDPMRWDYYQYIISHPISAWRTSTHILYGGLDDMQSRAVMEDFSRRFGCDLAISENSRHPFMEEEDLPVVNRWQEANL